MSGWNLGSVAAFVLDVVDGVPASISGIRLMEMADQQQKFVGDRIGVTIGSTDIPLQYQSMVWKFTAADCLDMMNLLGVKAQSVSMGDFSITKGANSATQQSSQQFRESAFKEMESYGVKVKFYKALG